MRAAVLILLSLSLAWGGLANAATAGESNATFVTCGKEADVVDDNGAKLFTLNEYERLILEPGWLDKAKNLGKRNVLVPALFPTYQNTRAWVNSYLIAAIDSCDHFANSLTTQENGKVSTEDRRNDGNRPINVEAGKNYRICAEDETAVIYNTEFKDSGVMARKYEKIYLEKGWRENTKVVKIKKKKVEVTPVAFPERGFIRGYVRSELVQKLFDCPVYQAQLAQIEAKAAMLEGHAIALSNQYGGYASEYLRKAAWYAKLEALNLPQKFARTEEAEKIAELAKIKEGILADANKAEQAAQEAYKTQVSAYQAFQAAEGAAKAADDRAAAAKTLFDTQIAGPQKFIDSVTVESKLEERMKLGTSLITIASFEVNKAFAELEAKELRVTAEIARKASFEASMEAARLRIAAIRARAEANRYRISIFPLPMRQEDLAAIPELEKWLGVQMRYLSEVNSLVAGAKAAEQEAYFARRAASGHQMIQFMRQIEMDQATKVNATAEGEYKAALSDWQIAQAGVYDARMILRMMTDNGRETDSMPPDELVEAEKRIADAEAKAAQAYFDLTKSEIKKQKASLAAEVAADNFILEFVSKATESLTGSVAGLEERAAAVEQERARQVERAKAAQNKMDKITGLLRELVEANKEIRRKKRKREDAEIDATVAGNMVKQAQKKAAQAIADLKTLQPVKMYADNRLETYQENAARAEAKKLYDAVFEAEELAKTEPLKIAEAEAKLSAAKAKFEEMEARVKSAELILQIELIKVDGVHGKLIETCEADVATAKANRESALAEITVMEGNLKAVKDTAIEVEVAAKEAREGINLGNERVRASAARQEAEQKAREEAAAQAAAAKQAEREAEWKRMAALYPPGYETARTEAWKNYEKWARKHIEGFAAKAEAKGIRWQEEGLQVVPGEIPEEMVDEMVEKYQAKPCRLDDTDELKCLSCNMWFEARGEAYEGKLLSGRSVMNRVKAKAADVPTVCGTIYQWKWYSWANILHTDPSNPNRKKAPAPSLRTKHGKVYANHEFWAYKEGVKAAIQVLQEDTPYILNHYWAVGVTPYWSTKTMCKLTKVRIDDHYACYLPIGEDPMTLEEIKAMLREDPEQLGREE